MGTTTADASKRKKPGAGRTNLWLLLQLAAVLLVLTVAVNYVFQHVGNSLVAGQTVTSWEYIYTNSPTPPSGRGVEWQTANAFTPMSREKTGAYLHLRTTLEGAQEERQLILRTDHAPLYIQLNGEPVYDDHYSTDEWVGNRYNAVLLPAGDGEITVAVSMRLPFAPELTAQLAPAGRYLGFRLNGGLVLAGGVLLLGLLAAVLALLLPSLRKKRRYGLAVAGLLGLYGLTAALPAIAGSTYWINLPLFYPLTAAAEIGLLLVLTRVSMALLEIRSVPLRLLLWLSGLLAAATAIALVVMDSDPRLSLGFIQEVRTALVLRIALCIGRGLLGSHQKIHVGGQSGDNTVQQIARKGDPAAADHSAGGGYQRIRIGGNVLCRPQLPHGVAQRVIAQPGAVCRQLAQPQLGILIAKAHGKGHIPAGDRRIGYRYSVGCAAGSPAAAGSDPGLPVYLADA